MAATAATKLGFGVGDVMDGLGLSPLGGAPTPPVVEGGRACSLAAAAVQGPRLIHLARCYSSWPLGTERGGCGISSISPIFYVVAGGG